MLLRHVIPTEFKIIRYYGFYRKKHKLHDKMVMLIDKAKYNIRNQFLKYITKKEKIMFFLIDKKMYKTFKILKKIKNNV